MAFSFGRQQIGKPTPASIAFKITLISVVLPVVSVWLGTASYIPNDISNILVSIFSLIVAIANAIKPLFGVHVEDDTVPTKKVKEVEDKPQE